MLPESLTLLSIKTKDKTVPALALVPADHDISRSAESRLYPHRGRPVAPSSQFRQRRAAPAAPAAGAPGSSRPSPAAAGQIIPLTQPAEQLW